MKENARVHIGTPPETGGKGPFFPLPGFAASGLAVPVLAAAALALLMPLISVTPLRALYYFFLGPFFNIYSFGNMLNSAVPLILGGAGVSAAMKAGSLNLGGEGQIYAGAFTAAVAALGLARFGAAGGLLALLCGACVSGAAAVLCGFFKARWNTSELITSFLLSNALILMVNYLINGPFLDPHSSLQSTAKIDPSMRLLPVLPPSNLNVSLFIALALAAAAHIFLERTRTGYELRMTGTNELFARYGGINIAANTVLAMFLSGAFYGIAGGLAVFGTHHAAIREFSSGMGWNALAAALLARFSLPWIVPAALFFAWVASGARAAAQNADFSIEAASIVQALVFFLAASSYFGKRRR